jgi:hypothetical protein
MSPRITLQIRSDLCIHRNETARPLSQFPQYMFRILGAVHRHCSVFAVHRPMENKSEEVDVLLPVAELFFGSTPNQPHCLMSKEFT